MGTADRFNEAIDQLSPARKTGVTHPITRRRIPIFFLLGFGVGVAVRCGQSSNVHANVRELR
jgi:hypothetical protein